MLAICPLPGLPSAAHAAAAGSSGTVAIITITRGGQLESGPILRGHSGPIRTLCLIAQGAGRTLLAAAGNDGTISIWELTNTGISAPGTSPPATCATGQLVGHTGWIWSLAAIPAMPGSPPRLASAGADHTIRIWEPASSHACGLLLAGHTDQVRAVTTATSDDGRIVMVSGGHDGTIRLWDPLTGAPGAIIPLGIPVHALLQQPSDPASRERTGGGATITAGLRTGIVALDLHHDLFRQRSRRRRSPAGPDT